MSKLGRNEPCWCGSGLKYKNCHLDRQYEKPVAPWEASAQAKAAFTRKLCSAPREWHDHCKGNVVRAHTVPKSSSLRRISKDGHVYAILPSLEQLTKNGGRLKPELVGINLASTFTGFCAAHDDAIFAPIEKASFDWSPEQCFLLGYRATTRELYTKQSSSMLDDLRKSLDRGRDPVLQKMLQEFASTFGAGTDAGLRDSRVHQAQYDAVLVSRDFRTVRAYVIETDAPPPVMCAGGKFPTETFDGTGLQDLSDLTRTPDAITCTSFWGGERGAVVFSWLAGSDASCIPFIRSLHAIPDASLATSLVAYMFSSFENVFMSPDWWDGLDARTHASLEDLIMASVDPLEPAPPIRSGENMIVIDPWTIVGRGSVGFEL